MEQIDKRYLIPGVQLNQKEMIGKGTCDLISFPYDTMTLGQVGVVYRGILTRNNIPQPVAIKTIKGTWITHYVSFHPIIVFLTPKINFKTSGKHSQCMTFHKSQCVT